MSNSDSLPKSNPLKTYSVLRRAGVFDKICEKGLVPDSFTWRKLDGSVISKLTGLNRKADTGGFVILGVYELASLLYEELSQQATANVHWNHRVVTVGQDETSAWVDCENGKRFKADFVVGCDGGTSTVRKSLFGERFPGKTWEPIIVATNVC